MTGTLRATSLDDSFAPFGDIIAAGDTLAEGIGAGEQINEGTCTSFRNLARVQHDEDGWASISIFRARPRELPLPLRLLERHPLGSQAFIPLIPLRFIVVVAGGERPAAENAKAFLAERGQGVNIRRNVWHHPLILLDSPADFLVIERAGAGANLELRNFGDACQIAL